MSLSFTHGIMKLVKFGYSKIGISFIVCISKYVMIVTNKPIQNKILSNYYQITNNSLYSIASSFTISNYMKLLTYLQKTHSITRREFKDMLDAEVISCNDTKVESFNAQINIGDTLSIQLPNQEQRTQTIHKLPYSIPKLVLFHKPKGVVVSKHDPHNKTIYDILPEHRISEYRYIGRLDKDSTWLLLLTNDPKLVDQYENPKNNIHKIYQVEIDKDFKTKHKIKCKKWLMITEDGQIQENAKQSADFLTCVTVSYRKTSKGKHQLIITLNEGKKRHIRRLLKALWYKIYSLHRLKVGKRHIDNLRPWKRRMEKAMKRSKKVSKIKKNKLAIKKWWRKK